MADDEAGRPRKLKKKLKQPVEIGWCELIDLPELGLSGVHAKIDSGAATSSLYATRIRYFEKDGRPWAAFTVPKASDRPARRCEAPVIAERAVKSSNGVMQKRYVIETEMRMGPLHWVGHMTLANRRSMAFPVLIGRRALRRGFRIDCSKRWLLGAPPKERKI